MAEQRNSTPHYLILEPYYGGSHQAFLQGLTQHIDADYTLITLPARKWKQRMQLAAPYMAEQIIKKAAAGNRFDAILSSTFLDLPVLQSLLARANILLPTALYFHENQFAYPMKAEDKSRHHFAAINCNSALCADAVAFNSNFNRESFLQGIKHYVHKAADFPMPDIAQQILNKSKILYPGMDYSLIDQSWNETKREEKPVIVWNHRWEDEKKPDIFFRALFELEEKGAEFQLIVLGESFRNQPEIFNQARERLASRILHFGYCSDKKEYCSWLRRGTIVVSTAIHEFFGISVLEAVRAGCRPLVPDALSYPELFPQKYRYSNIKLTEELSAVIRSQEILSKEEAFKLTDPYSWEKVKGSYTNWLRHLTNKV